jgi:hypothetical protein
MTAHATGTMGKLCLHSLFEPHQYLGTPHHCSALDSSRTLRIWTPARWLGGDRAARAPDLTTSHARLSRTRPPRPRPCKNLGARGVRACTLRSTASRRRAAKFRPTCTRPETRIRQRAKRMLLTRGPVPSLILHAHAFPSRGAAEPLREPQPLGQSVAPLPFTLADSAREPSRWPAGFADLHLELLIGRDAARTARLTPTRRCRRCEF